MNISNGLEYLNNTKRKLTSRLQGKGINVTNDTPFSSYPDSIESELQNKSWVYPSTWYQLTPKSEFPDHTAEVVMFDNDYIFTLYIVGSGTMSFTLLGSSGEFYVDNKSYQVNQSYTLTSGLHKFRICRGIGIPSTLDGITTVKAVFTFSSRLTGFYPKPNSGESKNPRIPILAVRIKDTTTYAKTIYFGEEVVTSYRALVLYMQYCDLSMVTNLQPRKGQFYECFQLVKVEFQDGFVPGNSSFVRNYKLTEVVGLDFVNEYERTSVFASCNRFKPPSFNFLGSGCYSDCNLSGMTVNVSPSLTTYPGDYYIRNYTYPAYTGYSEAIGDKFRIVLPDTMTNFAHNAFKRLDSGAILRLPSCHATLTTEPTYMGINSSDAFIGAPFRVENGENFYLDKPIGIAMDTTANHCSEEHLYLPHVPLRFIVAVQGHLRKITFDWENTDFGDCIASSTSGYVIDIMYQKFEYEDLLDLFNVLPTPPVPRNIRITGNPGVSKLTEADLAIVTDKGYVVTK